MMKVYYDKDADLSLIKGKKVAIVGYGSQGHAHAQNLNDSGVKVTVGLRKGGASWDKVKKAGLKVAPVADAVKGADFVIMLMPDEHIAAVYREEVEPNIKKGGTLAFLSVLVLRLRWQSNSKLPRNYCETQPAINPLPRCGDYSCHLLPCPKPGALGKTRVAR